MSRFVGPNDPFRDQSKGKESKAEGGKGKKEGKTRSSAKTGEAGTKKPAKDHALDQASERRTKGNRLSRPREWKEGRDEGGKMEEQAAKDEMTRRAAWNNQNGGEILVDMSLDTLPAKGERVVVPTHEP